MAALARDGAALRFGTAALRDHDTVCLAALKSNPPAAWPCLSARLQREPGMVRTYHACMCGGNGRHLGCVERCHCDRWGAWAVGRDLPPMPPHLLQDKGFVIELLSRRVGLRGFPEAMRADHEILEHLLALPDGSCQFSCTTDAVKDDAAFARKLILGLRHHNVFRYLSARLRGEAELALA